jgi:hypothetical protein
MLKARIRLMACMAQSEMKNKVIEELKGDVEREGTCEDRACLYEVLSKIHQEKMDFAWSKVMEGARKGRFFRKKPAGALAVYEEWKEERTALLRNWAKAAEGHGRLRAWGHLLAALDVKEDREVLADLWDQAKAGLMAMEEADRQNMIIQWIGCMRIGCGEDEAAGAILSKRNRNCLRLAKLYPLEPAMGKEARQAFYKAMVRAHLYEDEEKTAADWALKGARRLEPILDPDQMFLYLERVNVDLGLVDDRERECASLMRMQWQLAKDLGAHGTGAKLSLFLLKFALDDQREKEAKRQWIYLDGLIASFGKQTLFDDGVKEADRWIERLKKQLDQMGEAA